MIKIEKPRIESGVRLVSYVVNEKMPLHEDLWFEVGEEYGQYLCDEVCDAFVVAMLIPAVQTQQDIECDCISEKLLYNLDKIVSYLLQTAWNCKRIKIKANKIVCSNYHGSGVGTGCSLGIDSFASVFAHSDKYCTTSYCLTHLTNFNVGAFGSKDPVLARESWRNDLKKVKLFAEEYGLPLVTVDSNLGTTNNNLGFDAVFLFRNAAAVLSLQKLFGRYFIASGRTAKTIKLSKGDVSCYESLLVPLFSTESCDLILSEGDMTRVDKTKFVCETPYVKKHLYVCWKEIFKNEWPNYWKDIKDYAEKYRNCTRCNKCMRTCLTLDLLGCLDDYKDIFDLPQYYKTRDGYIKKVLAYKNGDSIMDDIYKLMLEKQYPIPFSAKIGAYAIRLKAVLQGLINKIICHK